MNPSWFVITARRCFNLKNIKFVLLTQPLTIFYFSLTGLEILKEMEKSIFYLLGN